MSPDKICPNIFFNPDSSVKNKGTEITRIINTVFRGKKIWNVRMLKNTKAYSRRNRICLHGLVPYLWEQGKFGEEGKKAPFESIQGRIVSTNKEYSSSSPQVRCNRWKEGARAMLREEDSACCTCMQRGRKPSIGIHRTAGEFHLYANSKPRCDPCFHLEIPARRVDPISRFHGTTYHPLPTTRRVRAPTNN